MNRRTSLSWALLILLSPAPAAAQLLPYQTANFDMAGVWEVDPTSFRADHEIETCPQQFGVPMGNRFMWGADYFTLEKQDVSDIIGEGAGREQHFIISYTGKYFHRHTFIYAEGFNVPPSYCGFFDMEFDVTATLKVYLDDPLGLGAYEFNLQGTLNGTPPFGHGPTMSINTVTDNLTFHFYDPEGRTFIADMDFAELPIVGPEKPASCTYSSVDPGVRTFCGGSFYNYFRRRDRAPEIDPRGALSGRLRDTLPDGTETQDPVTHAKVRLLLQPERVRDKQAGESDVAYRSYLARIAAESSVVDTRDLVAQADGRFSFDDIAIFGKKEAGAVVRGLYTFDIREAYREVDLGGGQTTRIDYLPHKVYNARVADPEQDIHLPPGDALGVKSRVARDLRALGPNGYGPTEDAVLLYLDGLLMRPGGPTDAEVEGVRRAVWAERATLYGAKHAQTFLKEMMSAFGTILADVVGEFFSTKNVRLANSEKRFKNLDAAQNFERLNSKGFKGFGSGTAQRIQDNMSQALSKDKRLRNARIANQVKLMVKYMIVNPINNQLTDPNQKARLALFSSALNALVDIVFSREWKGALQLAIKEIAKSFADDLFDTSFQIPSYTASTNANLITSELQMSSWAVSDDAAYRTARTRAVREIQRMNEQAGKATTALETAKLLSQATASAEEIFALGETIPAFKAAKTASKFAKYASNLTAFAAPSVMVFKFLPDQTEAATNAIFGISTLRAVDGDRLGNPLNWNSGLWPEAQTAVDLLVSRDSSGLGLLEVALGDDDVPAAIDLLAGASGTLESDLDTFLLRYQRVLAATEGTITATTSMLGQRMAYAADELFVYESELDAMRAVVRDFALAVLEDRFSGPEDDAYLAERAHALNAVDSLRARIERLRRSGADLDAAGRTAGMYRVALTEPLVISSLTGGGAEITQNQETFVVRATIRNVSYGQIDNLSARLVLTDPTASATVSGGREQPIGTLGADDATEGSGPDEVEVSWQVPFNGTAADAERISLRVELLESGDEPVSFFAVGNGALLTASLELSDRDLDGMPNSYEVANGLDPDVDDASLDSDSDGLSSVREYLLGTDPSAADTDGDGVDDGVETTGRSTGRTDPLRADTDGDGTDDGADGAPNDPMSTTAGPAAPEPEVALATTRVDLASGERFARVAVSNAGGGTLHWTALVQNEAYVRSNPSAPDIRTGPDELWISVPAELADRDLTTTVIVADIGGNVRDFQTLTVVLGEGSPNTPGPDAGVGDSTVGDSGAGDGPSDAGVGPGVDGGGTGPESSTPGDDSGCGCSASGAPTSSWWAWVPLLLLIARRREGRMAQ